MASIQVSKKYEGKQNKEIYTAAIAAIPNAGLQVWKKREIANLVMATGSVDGQEIRCNIVVNMANQTVIVSAEADKLSEDVLTQTANRFIGELDKLLA